MKLTKEQALKIFDENLKHVKKRFKEKIAIYDPLDLKAAYKGFIQWVHDEDFKALREMPENCNVPVFLDGLIKSYLVENAYYALEDKFIRRRMMNKLGILNPNEIKLLKIVDFINGKLELNHMEKLKKFAEKCQFKTFLSTVVTNLLYDFWRELYKKEENETKYEPEFEALFDLPVEDPVDALIESDEEEVKSKASKVLRELLKRLDFKEKLVLRLKYEQGMKVSGITRTLGTTRHKAEQFIKQIEQKLSYEIHKKLALPGHGGNHEASWR